AGSMPVGPEVVTTDEVDVSDLAISSTLNGTVMQSARTSQMLISVPAAVEFFSSFTRLSPGDVIATGTPGGVGFARTPPVWMEPGDVIEVTVEDVGTIRNRVVAEQRGPSDWRAHTDDYGWLRPAPGDPQGAGDRSYPQRCARGQRGRARQRFAIGTGEHVTVRADRDAGRLCHADLAQPGVLAPAGQQHHPHKRELRALPAGAPVQPPVAGVGGGGGVRAAREVAGVGPPHAEAGEPGAGLGVPAGVHRERGRLPGQQCAQPGHLVPQAP